MDAKQELVLLSRKMEKKSDSSNSETGAIAPVFYYNSTMKLLVMVASNFEDVELIATLDILSREAISYDLVSIENKTIVQGKYEAMVKTIPFKQIESANYGGLFLHGGPGHKLFLESEELIKIIKTYHLKKKIIAAICAAPEVLLKAKIIDGIKITSFPGLAKNGHNTGAELEVSDHIITGRDFKSTVNFATELVRQIKK